MNDARVYGEGVTFTQKAFHIFYFGSSWSPSVDPRLAILEQVDSSGTFLIVYHFDVNRKPEDIVSL